MKVERVADGVLRIFTPLGNDRELSEVSKIEAEYFTNVVDEGFYKDWYFQDVQFNSREDMEDAKEELKPWTRK